MFFDQNCPNWIFDCARKSTFRMCNFKHLCVMRFINAQLGTPASFCTHCTMYSVQHIVYIHCVYILVMWYIAVRYTVHSITLQCHDVQCALLSAVQWSEVAWVLYSWMLIVCSTPVFTPGNCPPPPGVTRATRGYRGGGGSSWRNGGGKGGQGGGGT